MLRGNDLYDSFGSGVKLSADGLRLVVAGTASIYGSRGYINIYDFVGDWNIVSNMQMTNGYDNGYFGNEFDINSDGSLISSYTRDLSFSSDFDGSTSPVYSYENSEFDNLVDVSIELINKNTSEMAYSISDVKGYVDESFKNFVSKTVFSFDIDKTIKNNQPYSWRIKKSSSSVWSLYEDFELYVNKHTFFNPHIMFISILSLLNLYGQIF